MASPEEYGNLPEPDEYDTSELKANLRREFDLDEDGFDEPDVANTHGRWGNFQLVGHGSQTSDLCGRFRWFVGCARTELHNIITLDGKSYKARALILV